MYLALLRVSRFCTAPKLSPQLTAFREISRSLTQKYNCREIKGTATVSMLQIHDTYKIFNKDDWVLSSEYGWADLAAKLTHSKKKDPTVILVSPSSPASLDGTIYIEGHLIQPQAAQSVKEALGPQRKINTALIGWPPQFTGELIEDSALINIETINAITFGLGFMQAGGTFVCRSLKSMGTPFMENFFKSLFNEVMTYQPSFARKGSPMVYYILKGFIQGERQAAAKAFLEALMDPKNTNKQEVLKTHSSRKVPGFNAEQMLRNQAELNFYTELMLGADEVKLTSELKKSGFGFLDLSSSLTNFKEQSSKKITEEQYQLVDTLDGVDFSSAIKIRYGRSTGDENLNEYNTIEFSNGQEWEGKWVKGRLEGPGKGKITIGDREFTFAGDFKNGLAHGRGKAVHPFGKYRGYFANGMFEGKGTMEFENGNLYEGQWKNGFMEGKGVMYSANRKQRVKGIWKENRLVKQQDL